MDSIPARLRRNGTDPQYKSRTGYGYKKGIEWVLCSFEEYYLETLRAAKSLHAMGITKGKCISILSFNRPEWVIADIACMMVGGVPAGIYQTCSPQEVQYIINHSESTVVFVENQEQWDKVYAQLEHLPLLKHIITFRGFSIDHPLSMKWDDFLNEGAGITDDTIDASIDSITPNQPATFIYTSGTTGPPKAVMLSHNNLIFTSDRAISITELREDDCTLSYLPLSHIAEQVFSIHGPISAGASVYFAQSIEALPQNLIEIRPTVFFGVPRIWEKIFAKLQEGLAKASFFRKKMADWAINIGKQHAQLLNSGQTPTGFLAMQYSLAKRLVFDKVKERIGLSRTRVCVSGAAPISAEILTFFSGLNIIIHEVYGQSEDCGPTTFNQPKNTKFGTVGTSFPDVEVKIADDDEILVRGENVFLGYYKDEEATQKALIDGWLHSGDLGRFDDNGFLRIIGRKKEIIITAGGKNIAPKNIESALRDIPLISQAIVIGDERPYLIALLTLDEEYTTRFCTDKGLPQALKNENSTLIETLQKSIDEVNSTFARVEHIRKFAILPRDFSIEEQELTPTLKMKRSNIARNWTTQINTLYEERN
jgi:long-chain acyl-CoA synthetase